MRTVSEIQYRRDFPRLCNARGLKVAVEIGTDQGRFAKQFMELFQGDYLYCVDPYEPYGDMRQYNRQADMMQAVLALQPWYPRVRFLVTDSVSASKLFPRGDVNVLTPDFVYIDGLHTYEAVVADMEAWWPKLSDNGILAGDDYADPPYPGLIRAVNEFAEEHGTLLRIVDGDAFASWYMYKSEPEVLTTDIFAFHR